MSDTPDEPTPEQIKAAYAIITRRAGQAKSEAKTKACRENGKKGGWPKGRPRGPRAAEPSRADPGHGFN